MATKDRRDRIYKTWADVERFLEDPPLGSVVFEIGPDTIAKKAMDLNDGNRQPRKSSIAAFASDMANKQWGLTGDTIKFSDQRRLRDGQNRLMACLQSNTAFMSHVVFGIEDHLFENMDQGKNRDAPDLIQLANIPHHKDMAVAAQWLEVLATQTVKFRSGRRGAYEFIRPREVLALVRKHREIVRWYNAAKLITTQTPRGMLQVGMVMALLEMFERADPELGTQFATVWGSGHWKGRFAPLETLQQHLRGLQSEVGLKAAELAAPCIITWNLVYQRRKGRKTMLAWHVEKNFPLIEGLAKHKA